MTPEQVIQRLNAGDYDPWTKEFVAEVRAIVAAKREIYGGRTRYKVGPYEAEILKRYEAGEMVKNIAADYRITEGTIHNVLKRYGVVPRRKRC